MIKKKSLVLIVLLLLLSLVGIVSSNNFVCSAESETYRVCVTDCNVFTTPNSALDNNVLEVLKYGSKIKIKTTLIDDLNEGSNLKFYPVLDNDDFVVGYVLCSSVISDSEQELFVKFQPNAKLNADSEIYNLVDGEYQKLKINGQEITLSKDTKIKLLEKYDKNKTYSQISFSYENEIRTGYVLTKNIQVSGFNYYFLIAIFLIVIIASTVIPIVVKNWKKNKKSADR